MPKAAVRSPWLRLVLFALLLAVPAAVGELYVRSLPNAARAKHAYLSRHAAEVDVLVLGSSHTYYGLTPRLLSPHAYNAAQVSQTLRYDDWVLHAYPFRRLRWVIVPISDFTLYEQLEGGPEWYLANRYRLYMDCSIHPRLSVYDWEVTAFPVFLEKLKSLWQTPRMRWSAEGQGLEYTREAKTADWDNGTTRAAHNRYLHPDTAALRENLGHLASIAGYCRSHGARLLLITTPLRPSYRRAQDPHQLADIHRRLRTFLARHPEVRYADFSADPRFTADDFYDADHLTTQGAARLSGIVRAIIGG